MADKTPTPQQEIHKKEIAKQRRIQKAMFEEAQEFRRQFAERALKLVTSGFGLVSALAWNELIKEVISVYIKPLFGESSGLISLLIYAVIVTALAVFITYQLSKFGEKKED
jgi:hypothetical protein